jgi:hypothetical protein
MLERVPHPAYSPDLSPCDLRPFGILKQKITHRVFQKPEEILTSIRKIWNDVTLERLRCVFSNWIERIEYVLHMRGNTKQNDTEKIFDSLSHDEIEGCTNFFTRDPSQINPCGQKKKTETHHCENVLTMIDFNLSPDVELRCPKIF